MTDTDGTQPVEDGVLTRRPTRRTTSERLTLAPVTKAPIARPGGVNVKPTGSLTFSALDDDGDWDTPEKAAVLTPVVSGDWGDDDENSEGDWETSPVVTSPLAPAVSAADWEEDEGDWETSPSPVTSSSPVTSLPQVEETRVTTVIPVRPVSPRASVETPASIAPPVSPKAVSPKRSTVATGPAGTPLPRARHRAGEPVKRSRPLRRPQLQARDLQVLELLAVMRVTTSQHIIKALESRESEYAVMESSTGVVPLSPAVLEKRLSILERGGFTKRYYGAAFSRSKPVWLSTNKGVSVTSYATSIKGVNTRSANALDTSLQHYLLISAEIARLAKGAVAVRDDIVKKALSEAVELARPQSFTPAWDAQWMQPLTDAAHLAPCDRFSSPIEPDLTVVNEADNAIAFYVEVETSPKPLAVYEAKMRTYAAAGKPVYWLVGTTAAVGQRDIVFITRRLEVAKANLGLSDDLISIEKADLAWAHPDPAAYRAEAMGEAA